MNRETILFNAITEVLKKYPQIEKAVLFGSRARGDFTDKSDYDIAIYGVLEQKDMTAIRNAFREDLPTLHKIDLIFMQEQTDNNFISNIQKEGKTFYGETAK